MKLTFFTVLMLAVASIALAHPPTPPGGGSTPDDTAYNATSWDANTDAATKNALRDKIETLAGGHDSVTINAATAGLTLSTQEITLDELVDDIAELTDPNADRGLFWDDSAGANTWFTFGEGLAMTATTLTIDTEVTQTDVAETITANWVNTANPWADNEVADNITIDLATLATTVTVSDDENADDDQEVVFTTDNANLESDGDFTYNPLTGTLTATILKAFGGNLTTVHTDPNIVFDDLDGADGELSVAADDANNARMIFEVDEGGSLTGYLHLDAVSQAVETKKSLTMEAGATVSDGQSLNLSGITQTNNTAEGFVLPTWANDTVVGVPNGTTAWDEATDAIKVRSAAGWQSIGASAAPTDASYLTLGTDATLSAERVLTHAAPLNVNDAGAGSTYTIDIDTATATTDGVVELATDAEAVAGSADRAITPANLVAKMAAPGAIGGTTPATGAFTAITGTTVVTTSNITSGDSFIIGSADVEEAELEILDGATVSTATFNFLDATSSIQTQLDAKAGIADNDEISGVWEVQDDTLFNFGNDANFGIMYDETTDDALEISSNLGTDTTIAIANAGAGDTNLTIDGDITYSGTLTYGGSGDSYITLANNASLPGSGYQIFFEGGNLTTVENGDEKELLNDEDGATLTGTSWDFSAVTNFEIANSATSTADAAGEIAIDSDDNQFIWHDGSKTVKIDTTTTTDNYVLKYDNATATFNLEADATGGTPAWSDVTDPTSDVTLDHDAGEETNFTYTGNYTTGSQFLIQQVTGDPSGGVLFEARAADANTVVMEVGDGTNVWTVSTAGLLGNAGTATLNLAQADDLNIGAAQIDYDDMAGLVAITSSGQDLGSTSAEFNDLFLNDAGVIQLGADQDVTITHVADTGVLMELDDSIAFGDAAVFIESDDDGYLDLDADTGIRLNGDVTVSGTIQAAMDVAAADADGETIATADLNTVRISSGAGDWDLPADSCDSASGVWLTVVANAAHVASITSLDTSDIFVLSDGTALDAQDEVDTGGSAWNACTVLCVATNTWLVMDTNGTCADGGVP